MTRKIRVFLVEDDKTCCHAIKDYMIDVNDIEIVGVAHDGLKAIELIPMLKPDVMVLDLALPRLDGFGVLEKMSSMNLDIKPVVIVITANSRASASQLAFSHGVEYIMLKPYQTEDLIERIRSVYAISFANPQSGDKAGEDSEKIIQNTPKFRIMTLLNQYGVPSNRVGYKFLVDSLMIVLEDGDALGMVTKRIYPKVARLNKTTESNVERGIRHVIERAWRNTDEEILAKLYGNSVNPDKGRPTNAEFIANIAQKLQLEQMIG